MKQGRQRMTACCTHEALECTDEKMRKEGIWWLFWQKEQLKKLREQVRRRIKSSLVVNSVDGSTKDRGEEARACEFIRLFRSSLL